MEIHIDKNDSCKNSFEFKCTSCGSKEDVEISTTRVQMTVWCGNCANEYYKRIDRSYHSDKFTEGPQ